MAGFQIRSRDLVSPSARAEIHATDIDILTAGLNGVGVVSNCAVTAQGSPDMTVAIAAGTIRIAAGTLVAVTGGNGTITTADATNPRIDLISSSNAGVKTVTAGTAAASPKPPDLPAGHVALAFVYVAATDTAIGATEIDDKRCILPTEQGGSFFSFHPGFADPTAVVGTWTFVANTDTGITGINAVPNYVNSVGTAQNDALSFDIFMAAGTYTVTLKFRKSSNCAIVTVNLDAASQGTIDTYAASPIYGTGSVTAIVVAAGLRTWQFKAATKNGSSSNYMMELYSVSIRRTA